MSDKTISPAVKQVLELGPLVLFFAGFFLLRQESYAILGREVPKFVLLTGIFIPLTVLSTFLLWRLTGALNRMQLFTLALVVILGGMTVWLNDPRFIKMKPTALYLFFAVALFVGLAQGKSYLRALMGEMIPLTETGWMILTRNFALFFLALAILNEVIWRTMSDGFWLSFKLFGVTGAMFAFLVAHYRVFETHGLPSEKDKTGD